MIMSCGFRLFFDLETWIAQDGWLVYATVGNSGWVYSVVRELK